MSDWDALNAADEALFLAQEALERASDECQTAALAYPLLVACREAIARGLGHR